MAHHRPRRHLRLVGPPAPAPAPVSGSEQRATAALQRRTRASLDGLGIIDITAAASLIRDELRRHPGGRAEQDVASPQALRTVLTAHDDVIAWMNENDICVYHGQLG